MRTSIRGPHGTKARSPLGKLFLSHVKESSPSRNVQVPPDWWFEDVSILRIDHFVGVITAIKVKGMRYELIGAAIAQYASKWLPGLLQDRGAFWQGFLICVGFHGDGSANEELYVSKNEVTKMEEIDHFSELQILKLGSNRLRVMENLKNLTNLQELWLGRNRIKAVNLWGLKCIKKISLQSNRLTSMVGFSRSCT
ncbi:hypothetical protein MLD38_019831 [Melastoma candidum]|uniref:Uncharacterized protein n=1 Tax=Melastoma candidum TaxID=119954 RepID=A0ACB9QBB7_9MYRT|nr:hypothetical protein MLD38_019831 [Melastoma candidum]